LIVYADDILDGSDPVDAPPQYGPACLTYPKVLSKVSTPKLHAAKTQALKDIEAQNVEFFRFAFKEVSIQLLSVYQTANSIQRIVLENAIRGAVVLARRGPGLWRPTFEGGTNMSEEAEAYELSSCGTPKGMGYYVDEVQFEGFSDGKLLDAKFWRSDGRVGGALLKGEYWAGWKVVNQAERQLAVAGPRGVEVEWRIADDKVAEAVRTIFRAHKFSIRVVHIPP